VLASLRNRWGFTRGTKAACVAVATLAMASAARADFTVNYTVDLHTPDANHARFNFYTLNDGNHGSGTKLVADDIELVSDQPMVVGFRPDNGLADVSGVGAPDPYHSDRTFVNILGDPSVKGYNEPQKFSIVLPRTAQLNASDYANGTADLRVVGGWINEPNDITQPTNGVIATAAANGGHGALIASAVVPNNATYVKMIPWGLGGDTGDPFGDYIDPANPPPQIGHLAPDGYNELSPLFASVPEPGSMTLLAAGMLLCTSRRRRLTSWMVR
jgi:hypothetical protein